MDPTQYVFAIAGIFIPVTIAILTYLTHRTATPEGDMVLWMWGLVDLTLFLVWASIIMATIHMKPTSGGTASIVILFAVGVAASIGAFIYSRIMAEMLLWKVHQAAVSSVTTGSSSSTSSSGP